MKNQLFALTLLIVVMVRPAHSDEIDTLGMERTKCRSLREAGELEAAFECAHQLWEQRREEMTTDGKIEILAQLAELYSVSHSPDEAQRCYEAILAFDPHWIPVNFDAFPTSWRVPILDAYRAKGALMRSRAVTNIAVLDFEIGDVLNDDLDLDQLSRTLPGYITAYLQESADGSDLKGEAPPIKLVSNRDRVPLMAEIARSMELERDAAVHGGLPAAELIQVGKLEAIQGFLSGSITRVAEKEVHVALYLLDVETGQVFCPQTESVKLKELFGGLQKLLVEWASCAVEGASLDADAGANELGPIAMGVVALERHHQALELAEQERYDEALVLARGALDLRPDSKELQRFVSVLLEQQELSGLALEGPLEPLDQP